jgi:hypothetical protein
MFISFSAYFTPLTVKFIESTSCGIDSIDAAEVTSALKHLGEYLSPKQVAALIKEVDTNGNGQIEFGEFIYMVGQIRLGKINVLGKIVSSNKVSLYKFTDAELGELKTEFGSYDTSGDGRCVRTRKFVVSLCLPRAFPSHFHVTFHDPSLAMHSIDAAEVTTALKHLGEYKSQQQVTDLIKEVDSSGNGTVEFGEFIYMVGQIRLGKNNGLGKIVSTTKVSAYKFTDAELAKLKTEFSSYDTSGDGRCAFCVCS